MEVQGCAGGVVTRYGNGAPSQMGCIWTPWSTDIAHRRSDGDHRIARVDHLLGLLVARPSRRTTSTFCCELACSLRPRSARACLRFR
jgi:hypothetical protein